MVIENLHWADAPTLDHLAVMAAATAEGPVILIMTSRIEGDPLDSAWRQAATTALVTIDLAPLREDEALSLAGEFVESADGFARTCIERAEGNPLFLEQLLRSAEDATDEEVPGSVQSIVLARVDRLGDADKRALHAAAVLGQSFPLQVLGHLIDDSTYRCDALLDRHLVRPAGGEYMFSHALIWESVYASVLKSRRRELHVRAAAWYADKDPGLRAEHLGRAGDPLAPMAYLEAARGQTQVFHFEQARALVEAGLGLASDPAQRYQLLMMSGECCREMGRASDSIAIYREALEVAAAEDDRCRAWIGLAAGMRVTDDYDEAFRALDEAEPVARERGLDTELSQIHYYRGSLHFPLGNIEGCLEEHERALAAAERAGSPECQALALSGLGDAYYSRGHMITSHGHFRRCVELCDEHGFGRIAVANLYMVGVTRLYQNELATALDDCLAAAETAAKVGHLRAEVVARQVASYVMFDMADWPGTRDQSERALDLARGLGSRRFQPLNLLHLARVQSMQGRGAQAQELAEEAFAISQESGVTFSGPWVLGGLALITDDPAKRRWALDEGERLFGDGCVSHNYFRFYRDAIETSLDAGEWDRAEGYANSLEDYTRAEPLPWTDLFIAWGRILAAHGRGARGEETIASLVRLKAEAERVGLLAAVPAIDSALAP